MARVDESVVTSSSDVSELNAYDTATPARMRDAGDLLKKGPIATIATTGSIAKTMALMTTPAPAIPHPPREHPRTMAMAAPGSRRYGEEGTWHSVIPDDVVIIPDVGVVVRDVAHEVVNEKVQRLLQRQLSSTDGERKPEHGHCKADADDYE